MRLQRPQPSNKAKPILYGIAGVVVLLIVYLASNIQTTAPVAEVRKELNLNELQ
jgi:hypothetical protein